MNPSTKENIIDGAVASGAMVVNYLEQHVLTILTIILILVRIMNGIKEYRKKK